MNFQRATRLSLALISALTATASLHAADWPQILGPNRNGVVVGDTIAATWPKDGPPIRWQRKVGEGFSGPAVADGKLVLFHRVADQEVVECMEAHTGKVLWKHGYPTRYRDTFGFDNGPRAVPTIYKGLIYTYGADSVLTCLELAEGKALWSVDLKKQYKADTGFFGPACSPLVEGNAVMLNIGGDGDAGIVAFNKDTGALIWKSTDA
ncbi:MAG TPA: PQQ-binding-like beta-propeller repeat protein, partial [Roseimicrobium sp.]|nr:PQQ-binding-like beta-propeller repeat protein [Roseimicrobium sp.]